jgi:hypothetical protein
LAVTNPSGGTDTWPPAAHLAMARAPVGHLLEDRDVVDELEGRVNWRWKPGSWGM